MYVKAATARKDDGSTAYTVRYGICRTKKYVEATT
jgi:hypothetical protein